MEELLEQAAIVAARLKERGEKLAIAESSTGGLISASLLAVPGASAYFLGGAVVYTRRARRLLLDIPDEAVAGMRAETEPFALLMARTARDRFHAQWGLAETGAAGPSGSPYGDPPGRSCLAIVGPVERAVTIETGSTDRFANMRAFSGAALELLLHALGG